MAGVESHLVEWVEELLARQDREREPRWAENFFVGSEVVVEKME